MSKERIEQLTEELKLVKKQLKRLIYKIQLKNC